MNQSPSFAPLEGRPSSVETKPLLTRILVPLDGSACAEGILSQLKRLLERQASELILFQATFPDSPLTPHDQAERYLRRMAFQLTNDGYPSRYILRSGFAAHQILEAGTEEKASLIALSTHGRGGLERWVMGSVAEKVLQGSRLPVFVWRTLPLSLSRGKLESKPIRKFLVALDGSRRSLGSLSALLELARRVDAHVTLLHVDEPTPYEGRWESPDETLREAQELLHHACIPSTVLLKKGDPAEEILKVMDSGEIDLAALTTHGRSGPSRWVFGSVTAKVLRTSPTPLLVVRDQKPVHPSPGEIALGLAQP